MGCTHFERWRNNMEGRQMKVIIKDGGRSEAGFKGSAGDCVCRAICNATGLPYKEVYDRLAEGNATQRVTKGTRKSLARKRTARNGIYTKRKWFKDYMTELGFKWVGLQKVGDPNRVYLSYDDLTRGVFVVSMRRHFTCVIDGVCYDTYDPSWRGGGVVNGIWFKPNDEGQYSYCMPHPKHH